MAASLAAWTVATMGGLKAGSMVDSMANLMVDQMAGLTAVMKAERMDVN